MLLSLAYGVGCVADVAVDIDVDQDGLLASEEVDAGTDPENPDYDQDGFTDGDEVHGNTDPLNPGDHPYTGGWAIDSCRSSVVGEGYEVGMVSMDWESTDQFGETFHFYDFCNRVIMLVQAGFT